MSDRQLSGSACALIAFEGTRVDQRVAELVADPRVAGVTLYGSVNIEDAEQTRRLTTDLQQAAGRPIIIAVDQEGGQLNAAGPDTTPFAGNMALGAVGDVDLAWQVGSATGLELSALGINVNYAPVADIATRPYNPSLGIRSFGEDPGAVSRLTSSMVRGLQSSGVAATLKHFPGKGEAQVDPHLELPVLDLDLERLDRVEFAPFRAGIEAGANLLMIGHYGLPAVTGDRNLPASASSLVMRGLVRTELGFDGLIITDALDMGAFAGVSLEEPLAAGADLLLYGPAQAGTLPLQSQTSRRLDRVMAWLTEFPQPALSVIGSTRHAGLAAELAARSITLVRDEENLLPLKLGAEDRVLAVMPQPTDLTPADTSSLVQPGLAHAVRRHHLATTEITVPYHPSEGDIAEVVTAAAAHDVVIVGTIDASPAQNRMVHGLLGSATDLRLPVVTVALRTPYDLSGYPQAKTHVATYGIHPPSMTALADAVLGHASMPGRLPVAIPGLYGIGHGLIRTR